MMSSDQYEVIYTLRSQLAKKGFGRCGRSRSWTKDVTPEEKKVLKKYKKKCARLGVVGGISGALALAGVWKIAALGTALGVTGVIVGALAGAWLLVRASRIRLKMLKKFLMLPSEKSPLAAEARELLRTELPHNAYAQELLKKSELASTSWEKVKSVEESSKDK